jgi:hypothetical protein
MWADRAGLPLRGQPRAGAKVIRAAPRSRFTRREGFAAGTCSSDRTATSDDRSIAIAVAAPASPSPALTGLGMWNAARGHYEIEDPGFELWLAQHPGLK